MALVTSGRRRRGAKPKPATVGARLNTAMRARVSINLTLSPKDDRKVGVPCPSPFCDAYLQPDWWFISTPALADGFAGVFDSFEEYTRQLTVEMHYNNSLPHSHWGLYFYRELRLREACRVGHAYHVYLDFELGRNAGERYNETLLARYQTKSLAEFNETPTQACELQGPQLWTPQRQTNASWNASCLAVGIYQSACPQPWDGPVPSPRRARLWSCTPRNASVYVGLTPAS